VEAAAAGEASRDRGITNDIDLTHLTFPKAPEMRQERELEYSQASFQSPMRLSFREVCCNRHAGEGLPFYRAEMSLHDLEFQTKF
jgi:hypothetical protein